MKHAAAFLFAAALAHGATIYTESVPVSGGGTAWSEFPPSHEPGGFSISFLGANGIVGVGITMQGQYGDGSSGLSNYAPLTLQRGVATIGAFSSDVFSYFLNGDQGNLTLYDRSVIEGDFYSNVIASVPLIGYFSKTVTEYRSQGNPASYEYFGYATAVSPTQPIPNAHTPEPSTWILFSCGLMLFAFRRYGIQRRLAFCASRSDAGVTAVEFHYNTLSEGFPVSVGR